MGDEFGVSGTGEACMEHFGLTARGIADRAREALVAEADRLAPAAVRPEWTWKSPQTVSPSSRANGMLRSR